MQKLVSTKFVNIGKGWFNIHETSSETYQHGKIRKLLTVVKFMMQDTLRYLAMESTQSYVERMLAYIARDITVTDLFNVDMEFDSLVDGEKPRALFLLEVKKSEEIIEVLIPQEAPVEENPKKKGKKEKPVELPPIIKHETVLCFAYSTDPKQFVEAIVETFLFGLSVLTEVPQLERLIMPQLFKTAAKQVTPDGAGRKPAARFVGHSKIWQNLRKCRQKMAHISQVYFGTRFGQDLICFGHNV